MTPIYRLPPIERARLVAKYVGGGPVELTVNIHRRVNDTHRFTLTGVLICVASSGASSTTNTIVVIETTAGRVLWYPLALVENVTVPTPART